jgi:hypothetical protein
MKNLQNFKMGKKGFKTGVGVQLMTMMMTYLSADV